MTEETNLETATETVKEIQETYQNITNESANKKSRFIAFAIDFLITFILASFGSIGALFAIAYWLLRDGLDLGFMYKRSLGKNLMKLKVITTDGSDLDMSTSFKRNWTFALAFLPAVGLSGIFGLIGFVLIIIEGYLVYTKGTRIGDNSASTMVIHE